MKLDVKIVSTLVGVLAILAALGFSSPFAKLAEVKSEIREIGVRVDAHDVALAKLDYIVDWVKEERERRRRHDRR